MITSIERAMERKAHESDAINCGKIKTDVLELIAGVGRVIEMVNDRNAKFNLNLLRNDLESALHDSDNAGMDGIEASLADLDADDDADYLRQDKADYRARVR